MTSVTATRASGLLKAFNEAGVLSLADVHVASRLGALAGEADDRVLLAAALVVRGTRHGSVVLDLADAADTITPDADEDDVAPAPELVWPSTEEWVAACATSPLVTGAAGGPPLQMVASRLWLDRYWRQEAQVADDLLRRSADRPDDLDLAKLRHDLDSLFGGADEADQRLAAAVAALSRVSVIGGGPGTGKTTTVARLITVLYRQFGPGLRVALAAPTGKAAAQLAEAVRSAADPLTSADRALLARLSAMTLHRLLGSRPGVSSRFRHDRDNRLPYDVVIVDESSMVSLTLMARLIEALAPATRLVLVGDPDQLASVEAGAVLGDLVDQSDVGPVTPSFRAQLDQVIDGASAVARPDAFGASLRESVVLLRTVHRFDAGGSIAQLAEHVRAGRADEALALLRAQPAGLVFHETADDEVFGAGTIASVVDRVVAHETAVIDAARAGDVTGALDALDQHRLLCAHRAGPRGVRFWTNLVERRLALDLRVTPRADGRYAGQPLLVMSNDYETGLYNGDIGVVIRAGDELVAAFRRGAEPVKLQLVRLSDVRPLHAMTVHRGQGSQFDVVTVLLPLAASPLATRQTFYTAITRAASEVRLVGSAESVVACVQRQAARATGLRDRLTGPLVPSATNLL
jgi:exodeoxyribonuclease V alpha subunit